MVDEEFNFLVRCENWILNCISETIAYGKQWKSDYCQKRNTEAFKKLREKLLEKDFEWNSLTKAQATQLGFKRWSDEFPNLYLFPLWLLVGIKDGTSVVDIFGNAEEFCYETADADNRLGCLSFGINLEE